MRTAVILFNLGGPDSPAAVQPFLLNLFSDPAIMNVPGPLRWVLARIISRRRAPVAQEIYARMGGRSPILPQTEAQARALEEALGGEGEWRCFVAMRYWHPRAAETARQVAAWRPDRVVLLPLYPQYSSTTSASSLKEWRRAAADGGLRAPTMTVCCYPAQRGWIEALVRLTRESWARAAVYGTPRVLFSAHGLPRKVIEAGDPYRMQVERTAAAVVEGLGIAGLDWTVCFQSRVGPLEWIKPYTEDEILAASGAGRPLVVVPVAFVSEHSETLVELDIEYREKALAMGCPAYERVPAVATHSAFIDGLAALVRLAAAHDGQLPLHDPAAPACPPAHGLCARRVA